MAKGGGDKTYFVGHITHNKDNRSIGSKANGGLQLDTNVIQNVEIEENRQDKNVSPSQESKKVRFLDVSDKNNDDHGGGTAKVITSNAESASKQLNTTSKHNSKNPGPSKTPRGSTNSSPVKKQHTNSKQSYHVTPMTLDWGESGNCKVSSNAASISVGNETRGTEVLNDSKYKFHANENDIPDPELLVFPEKASSKNSNEIDAVTVGSERSENFRFHAQNDKETTTQKVKNKKQNKINIRYVYMNGAANTRTMLPELRSRSALLRDSVVKASDGTSGGKSKYTDSTPALPPARQNGSLVTSHGLLASQVDVSSKSRKSSRVSSSKQSIPSISRKNSESKSRKSAKSVKSVKSAKSTKSALSEQPESEITLSVVTSKHDIEDENEAQKSSPTHEDVQDVQEQPTPQEGDDKKPSPPTAPRPDSEKSKMSTSQKSHKSQKSQAPTESDKSPVKDDTKATVERDSNKFVAKYTRSNASGKSSAKMSEKSDEKSNTNTKQENEAPSPMSHATDESTSNKPDFKWHAPPGVYDHKDVTKSPKPKNVRINNYSSEAGSGRTSSTNLNVHNKKLTFKLKGIKAMNKKPKMYSRDKKASEITPRKEQERAKSENSRPLNYHLDREASIYRSHTQLWENEKEELTHHPSTNNKTDVMLAYTGERNRRDALKSAKGRRPQEIKEAFTVFTTRPRIPPWHEGEYVLNKRQTNQYIKMKSVYDKSESNKTREKKFLKQLQKFQIEMAKKEMVEMQQREKKKMEDKERQAVTLYELRQRFEDEAWHRFHTQYVTSRVLEHEKLNRFQYGLPEEPDGDPVFSAKIKRKKKVPLAGLNSEQLKKNNQKKYSQLFKANKGPIWDPNEKEPKMEGIDTVMLEVEDTKGNLTEKKRFVKDVIKEAKQELLQVPGTGNNTGLTPRSPTVTEPSTNTGSKADNSSVPRKTPSFYMDDDDDDDDDDDMSDIFERAKRKYNLDVDDDEDNISRIR